MAAILQTNHHLFRIIGVGCSGTKILKILHSMELEIAVTEIIDAWWRYCKYVFCDFLIIFSRVNYNSCSANRNTSKGKLSTIFIISNFIHHFCAFSVHLICFVCQVSLQTSHSVPIILRCKCAAHFGLIRGFTLCSVGNTLLCRERKVAANQGPLLLTWIVLKFSMDR